MAAHNLFLFFADNLLAERFLINSQVSAKGIFLNVSIPAGLYSSLAKHPSSEISWETTDGSVLGFYLYCRGFQLEGLLGILQPSNLLEECYL